MFTPSGTLIPSVLIVANKSGNLFIVDKETTPPRNVKQAPSTSKIKIEDSEPEDDGYGLM
jgi:hypothetical protein